MFDFKLEDGTGLIDSTSYSSVEFADSYALFLGDDGWADLLNEEKEVLLIQATMFVDDLLSWQGNLLNPDLPQSLNWPRTSFKDRNGRLVEGLPKAIVKATAQLAIYMVENDVSMNAPELKSQSWGNAREEYLGAFVDDDSPVSTLKSFLTRLGYGRSSTAFITSVRA